MVKEFFGWDRRAEIVEKGHNWGDKWLEICLNGLVLITAIEWTGQEKYSFDVLALLWAHTFNKHIACHDSSHTKADNDQRSLEQSGPAEIAAN